MTRPSMDQVRSVADFTTLFRWNLIFAQFPSAIAAPSSEDLNIRCESAELPKLTGSTITQSIRGHKVSQPGIHDYSETITLTFVETVDNVISNFLRSWREACWATNTGVTNPKSEVEAIILIQRLNSLDEPIWEYKLLGAFLQDFDPGGTLDGSSSDSLKPSLVIKFDRFEDQAL